MTFSPSPRSERDSVPHEVTFEGTGRWLLPLREGVLAAMAFIDELPEEAHGAVTAGDGRTGPSGVILATRNRVYWAVASGMRARLRDILRSHCLRRLSDHDLDQVFERCRLAGRPLGETMEREGLVTAQELRAALKQQTVESLLTLSMDFSALGQVPWLLQWTEGRGHTYNPKFSFSTGEIVAAVGARLVDEVTTGIVSDHLGALAETGCLATGFCPDVRGAPLFVGLQSSVGLSVGDLRELADWALAALEASPGFSAVAIHGFSQSAAAAAVAWRYEQCCYAALCPSRQSLQRVVAIVGNHDLPMVMATRLSVLERVSERTAIRPK